MKIQNSNQKLSKTYTYLLLIYYLFGYRGYTRRESYMNMQLNNRGDNKQNIY